MSNKNQSDFQDRVSKTFKQVYERIQDLVEKGNARRVVLRDADGDVLVESTLTIAAIVAFAIAVEGGWWFFLLAFLASVLLRVRVSIVHEADDRADRLSKKDEVVEGEIIEDYEDEALEINAKDKRA
jgi:predicted RNase H-related nuclease YkuK (DUF458 family)